MIIKILKCELVEKVSKKGNKYLCVEVYLTDTYKKIIFLEQAENELLKLSYNDFK